MPGGGQNQTTQQTSETRQPFAASLPLLQSIATNAQNAFNSGRGAEVYRGPRVAGFGNASQAGQASLLQGARAGMPVAQAASGFTDSLIRSSGATDATRSAVDGVLGVGTAGTGGLTAAADRMADPNSAAASAGRMLLGGPTQVSRSLQDVADGKYLGGANPYLDQQIQRTNADALDAVKSSFAASGRYGSGFFSGAATDALSRNEGSLRYQDYENERARQAQAAQAIDSGLLARTTAGAQLGMSADAAALQGQQALYNANAANNQQRIGQYTTALGAGQADRAAAQSAVGQVGAVQDALLRPGQTMAGVGAAQDAMRQRQIDARRGVFEETQNAPWRQLGLLSGVAMPLAGAGGTASGTTTVTQPQPSMLQQLLGTALAGANVASRFYGGGV